MVKENITFRGSWEVICELIGGNTDDVEAETRVKAPNMIQPRWPQYDFELISFHPVLFYFFVEFKRAYSWNQVT